MRRTVLISSTLLLAPLVAATATPSSAAERTSTIVRGVVTDSAGNGVPNITVAPREVPAIGHEAVRTDANGRYSVRVRLTEDTIPDVNVCAAGETAGNVTPKLRPTPADLAHNTHCTQEYIDLPSAATHTVDLTIYRRSTLSGTITDVKGKPIAGARVVGCPWYYGALGSDLPDRGDFTVTDSRGRYSLSLPAGGNGLTVTRSGYYDVLYDGIGCDSLMQDPPLFLKLEKTLRGIDVKLTRKPAATS